MPQTTSKLPISRQIPLVMSATLVACCCGCMARESQQGDATVYTSTLLNSLMLLAIGGSILAIGVVFFVLGVKPGKGRNRNPASHKAMALMGGMFAILVGLAILVIGVPYSFVAHITVHPDRVVMRDSVLWFANGDREIWYDSVKEFAREDKGIARKGRQKEELVIRYTGEPAERIEMGPRERAAYATLVQAHQQYLVDKASGAIAGGPPPSRDVIRYLAFCGAPDGYKFSKDIQLKPGDKAKICYEKQWQDITIVSASVDQAVEVTWDSFDDRRTMLSTIDVFVPEAVQEARLAEAEQARRAAMTPAQLAHEEALQQMEETSQAIAERRKVFHKEMAEVQSRQRAEAARMFREENPGKELPGPLKDAVASNTSPAPSRDPTQPMSPGMPRPGFPTPAPPATRPAPTFPPAMAAPQATTRKLKRYPIDIPLPEGAVPVTADTPLIPGVKLGACYWDKWEAVAVIQVHDDGSVKCKWDKWGSVYDMSRDDLIIAQQVLDELRRQQAFREPIEREWSDTTGKFKVTATYVDSMEGYVKLRKPDGQEVSVPISKLSLIDRRIITKLSAAK